MTYFKCAYTCDIKNGKPCIFIIPHKNISINIELKCGRKLESAGLERWVQISAYEARKLAGFRLSSKKKSVKLKTNQLEESLKDRFSELDYLGD